MPSLQDILIKRRYAHRLEYTKLEKLQKKARVGVMAFTHSVGLFTTSADKVILTTSD
jgi:hypothetical protein